MTPSGSTDFSLGCFPDHRFAMAQLRGDITGADIATVGRAIVGQPAWQPGFTEVWDVRSTETVDVVPSDLSMFHALETELAEALEGSRTIVIADRSMLRFSLQFYARMVRAFGREVRIAETAEQAAALLGIDVLPSLS